MRKEIRDLLLLQNLDIEIREMIERAAVIRSDLESILSEIERDERIIREEKAKEISHRVRSKEMELEVEDKKNRIDKYQSQLFKVKNNKEYTALIHEIELLKSDIRVVEDRILEVMEEGEGERDRWNEALASVAAARARYAEKDLAAREELSEIEGRIAQKRQAKLAEEEKIDPALRERYEMIFSRKPDRAVAAVRGEACTGCDMELTAQVLNDLARDEIICQCESCGRFIYLPEDDGGGKEPGV